LGASQSGLKKICEFFVFFNFLVQIELPGWSDYNIPGYGNEYKNQARRAITDAMDSA
jgi:hypothetical protein